MVVSCISTFIIFLSVVLTVLIIFTAFKLKNYTRELSDVITKAEIMKKDLIQLMDDALVLSQKLVDAAGGISDRTSAQTDTSENNAHKEEEVKILSDTSATDKVRVYDLARELKIPSQELVAMLKSNGISLTNHMNKVDEKQARDAIQFLSPEPDRQPTDDSCNQVKDEVKEKENQDYIMNMRAAHPYLAVRSLYKKGYQVWQIAKILGRGQGEINLILNLSNKKQTGDITKSI